MGQVMLAEPRDPMVGGISVGGWFQLFTDTHSPNGMGGFTRIEWPEPGGLADQPALVPEVLHIVQDEILEAARRNG